MSIAVIGGGAFGVMTAIRLAETGRRVTVFERRAELLRGTSANANRLHRGFHYPRDAETARQCARGFETLREQFGGAILRGIANRYYIASEGSLTSPAEYLAFCRRLGLSHRRLDLADDAPAVRNVALGVVTDELVYDRDVLRRLMLERLARAGAAIRLQTRVAALERHRHGGFEATTADGGEHFDAVVNCSYADSNRLAAQLGHAVAPRLYEYTAAAIVTLPWAQPCSLTVLDGPFVSLLPLGDDGRHLLYHVEHSVLERSIGDEIEERWLEPEASPFTALAQREWFGGLIERCRHWIPDLATAPLAGIVHGPRMVRADVEATDARRSSVAALEPGYLEVFSGKIDHCIWVADEVTATLGNEPKNGDRLN